MKFLLAFLFALCIIGFWVIALSAFFPFYKSSFEENGVYQQFEELGYSHEVVNENALDLVKYNHGIIEALDMDFYFDRDIKHMEDVRQLFLVLDIFVLAVFGISVFYIYLKFQTDRDDLSIFFKFTGVFILLILGVSLIGAMFDFQTWFIAFHEVFFDNEFWQLSYDNSNLIRFFPHEFFIKFIWYAVILSVIDALTAIGLGIWLHTSTDPSVPLSLQERIGLQGGQRE